MDNTLSQAEVDALLQAVKSGDLVEDAKDRVSENLEQVKVVSYNFRKPQIISGDQNRGFQVIHETFAKNVQSALLTNMKTPLEVTLVAIDYLTYTEFIMSVMNPTFMVILKTQPESGELVMEMNLPIILAMIDILLGGDGSGAPDPRELTMIEQSIVTPILNHVIEALMDAWANTAELRFNLQTIEYDPEYVRVTGLESSVLSATFDLRLGDKTGTMNICYPFEMIQPILDRVTARMIGKRERVFKSSKERIKSIRLVPIRLNVNIGRCMIRASDLGKLKEGDVLILDKRYEQPAEMSIGGRKTFYATPGVRRGKLVAQVVGRYSDDAEMKALKTGDN